MKSVYAYFDGINIKPLEDFQASPNQKIIITITDEFFEPVKKYSARELMGILSDYSKPELSEREQGEWERAITEQYSNS